MGGEEVSEKNDATDAPNATKRKDTSKTSPLDNSQKKSSKKRRSKSTGSPTKCKASAINQLISLKVEQLKTKQNQENLVSEGIRKKVALAKQFKEMVDCLGDPIQAVRVVPDFKIFLKPDQLA